MAERDRAVAGDHVVIRGDLAEKVGVDVAVAAVVGQLQQVAKKISDAGIDISYIYGSPVKQKMTLIIKTANDKKALRALIS